MQHADATLRPRVPNDPRWDRIGGHAARHLAAAASGGALALAYPSTDQGWLAWVALVPLVVVLERRGARAAAALGATFSVVASIGVFGWLFVVPGFTVAQFVVLAVYVALYPVAWCVGLAVARRSPLPIVVTAPAWWVSLETLRSHAGFLALPWATLAQTQHTDLPVLAWARWTGEAGVSFVVVLVGVACARAVERPSFARVALPVAAFVVVHALGRLAIVDDASSTLRVVVVQPRIGLAERETPAGREAIWRRLEAATRRADVAGADLVAWPETAIGDPRRDAALAARLTALSSTIGAALVVGSAETGKFVAAARGGTAIAERPKYNSAWLVERGALVGEPYRKRRLLPFAEYLPARGTIPWPASLVPDVVDGTHGIDAAPLVTHIARVGVLICWENAFAGLARQAVDQHADLIVHLVNDAWFGDTRAAAQHAAISVMRAAETGLPVVVASNAGPSELIDGHGHVLARLDADAPGDVVAASVPIGAPATSYARHGDVFAMACIGWSLAALVTVVSATPLRKRRLTGPIFSLRGELR